MTAVLTEEPRLEEKVDDASVEVDEEAEELQENGVDSSSKKKKKKKKKKKGGLHLFSQWKKILLINQFLEGLYVVTLRMFSSLWIAVKFKVFSLPR